MFVDSDHAGDKVPHRSRSGFLIHMKTTLVQWLSKKQSTVETSVFFTEFVVMKKGIRYKPLMMGISKSGQSYIYRDTISIK